MDFASSILQQIDHYKKTSPLSENIDTWRFQSRDPSRAYTADTESKKIEFIGSQRDKLNTIAAAFADDYSRQLLRELFCFRTLGPHYVRLPTCTKAYWDNYEVAKKWKSADSLKSLPPFEASIFDFSFRGAPISFEGWLGNAVFSFLTGQYYFSRNGRTIAPAAGDYAIDAGACFGDTALAFAASIGPSGRVYSFDPMPRHLDVIRENCDRNPGLSDRIVVTPRALWDQPNIELKFADAGPASRQSENGLAVLTDTIDNVVDKAGLAKIDFIKMDIEGAEGRALTGARETIRRFKPKLAIACYHSDFEMLEIPLLIKSLEPDYRLFLDHYSIHAEETVVYATCEAAP
jgi:FkbM family methyltransferase